MKLEYVSNPILLTSIRRSWSRVWKRLSSEGVVTTDLFVLEYVDCSEVELKYRYPWNFCLKVTVVATGEKFVATQMMSFRENDWRLYRVKGVK